MPSLSGPQPRQLSKTPLFNRREPPEGSILNRRHRVNSRVALTKICTFALKGFLMIACGYCFGYCSDFRSKT
jgi:hypothetical protein